MKTDLLIRHARQVVTFDQGQFKILENATIACSGSQITDIGDDKQFDAGSATVIDASEYVVLPGLIDSHTHTIFAGSREDEFEMKLRGATYAEIAQKGGGILNTMGATRKASKEELLQLGKKRLDQALRFGITTIEIKSGYGLSLADEIKILEVIRDLRKHTPMDIHATFLGAHSIPPEYKSKRDDYVKLVCDEMIPAVAEKKLAEFCDVFCETNVCTIDETRRIFETAKRYGLKLKLHADQLTNTGGAELCAEMGAVSADHLEHISDRGIDALRNSKTVAGLLPGCSFFLNMQYPPARKLIEAGIPVALATDFNPGSSMTQNLQLIMSIACTQMKMSPAEAVAGITLNAAKSLDRTDTGNIAPGFKADLVLFRVPNYKYIPYNFGQNHAEHVIKNGRMVF